jgi:hypothetical protein
MLSRGEKETIKQGFQIVVFAKMLKNEFEDIEGDSKMFTQDKRDLSSLETYISKAAGELLKKARYKKKITIAKRTEQEIKRISHFKLNAVIVKDDNLANLFYSKFAACYIIVRDLYYSFKDPKDEHEKKAMKWIKSAWTIINRIFKKHAVDGGLDWEDMKEKLDKKKSEYEFDVYMVAY